MEMEMSVGTRNLAAHSCASRKSLDTLAATHDMSGRARGSLATHRSASAVSDSAASTGNESLSLRSTHRRIPSPPPSAAAASAVSISDVLWYSPVPRFTISYRTGSCPDTSSSSTTPSANTSERGDGGPPATSSGAMYPRVPSIRLPRLLLRRWPPDPELLPLEEDSSMSSFCSTGSSPARRWSRSRRPGRSWWCWCAASGGSAAWRQRRRRPWRRRRRWRWRSWICTSDSPWAWGRPWGAPDRRDRQPPLAGSLLDAASMSCRSLEGVMIKLAPFICNGGWRRKRGTEKTAEGRGWLWAVAGWSKEGQTPHSIS
uniref:Uncharacterized protein n=1 Tax=Setaria italica TaxID=4555 RepID=K3YU99_SETIT